LPKSADRADASVDDMDRGNSPALENAMSRMRWCRWLILALVTAAPPAFAFNPQPDPPARMLNSTNTFSNQKSFNQKNLNSDRALFDKKSVISPGLCKVGTNCKTGTRQ
jgi:hypothetical protein